ncbi:uncharacterized protein LOC135087582 [Ostrinia nubilalis]|uniref:uncharacterized protein LOC135087582 n=1 Tax=Ostrinia nubilalis TaxID=29057 RepID=UPI0030824DF5
MSDVVFHLELAKECPITMARVTISSLQPSNKTKKLFNYALDKPCQHFVLGPILISSFNLNNNCKINKGDYDIHLNMLEKSTMFLGPSFFYGTYEFKFMAFNKVNNFLCVESLIRIEKADKSKI